ncbi:hypothetical protein [Nitrosospira multiformis]|uniref:hypothetical protein n=1 Tax=Nitrosospira multiformis TaxID=1231 RepID=UPI0011609566|nr:hypothetical protein [Nitrosospira multiformis]
MAGFDTLPTEEPMWWRVSREDPRNEQEAPACPDKQRGELIASDHEKALAWITIQGLRLPRRTPEVTVAPASDRTGRDGSILHQLKEAVRKSLSINVPKRDGGVNLPA